MTDAALINRARAGDRASLGELVRRCQFIDQRYLRRGLTVAGGVDTE